MRARIVVPDIYSDAAVGAEVYNVVFWVVRVGVVSLVGTEEKRVVVIALKRGTIHGKELVPC